MRLPQLNWQKTDEPNIGRGDAEPNERPPVTPRLHDHYRRRRRGCFEMREELFTAFAGKLRGNGWRGLLGDRAGFPQKLDRLTQPRVERGEFGIGGDMFLESLGLFRRKLAHEHGRDPNFGFLAWCLRSVGIHKKETVMTSAGTLECGGRA